MAVITAAMVKELRERTSAGMLDCKKALDETNGDMDAAIDYLRKKGIAKAAKKEGRIAAEGIIVSAVSADKKTGVILEFNSETDFAGKNEAFVKLANDIAKIALEGNFASVEELKNADLNGKTVDENVKELVAKIGENMNVRRFKKLTAKEGFVTTYIHLGGKIGVIIDIKGDVANEIFAKDVAMHIAALSPKFMKRDEVTTETLDKEKEIAREQLAKEGKPADKIEMILNGKMRKFYEENCLLEQPFVKDGEKTITAYIKGKIDIVSYDRFGLGEGIEREEVNFADEVRKTVEASK